MKQEKSAIEEDSVRRQEMLDQTMLVVMWTVYTLAFLASLFVPF